jgi:hypothetical protein
MIRFGLTEFADRVFDEREHVPSTRKLYAGRVIAVRSTTPRLPVSGRPNPRRHEIWSGASWSGTQGMNWARRLPRLRAFDGENRLQK